MHTHTRIVTVLGSQQGKHLGYYLDYSEYIPTLSQRLKRKGIPPKAFGGFPVLSTENPSSLVSSVVCSRFIRSPNLVVTALHTLTLGTQATHFLKHTATWDHGSHRTKKSPSRELFPLHPCSCSAWGLLCSSWEHSVLFNVSLPHPSSPLVSLPWFIFLHNKNNNLTFFAILILCGFLCTFSHSNVRSQSYDSLFLTTVIMLII